MENEIDWNTIVEPEDDKGVDWGSVDNEPDQTTQQANEDIQLSAAEGINPAQANEAFDIGQKRGATTAEVLSDPSYKEPETLPEILPVTAESVNQYGVELYDAAEKYNGIEGMYRKLAEEKKLTRPSTSFWEIDGENIVKRAWNTSADNKRMYELAFKEFLGQATSEEINEINAIRQKQARQTQPTEGQSWITTPVEELGDTVREIASIPSYAFKEALLIQKNPEAALAVMSTPTGALLATTAPVFAGTVLEGMRDEGMGFYLDMVNYKDLDGNPLPRETIKGATALVMATSGIIENLPVLHAFKKVFPTEIVTRKFSRKGIEELLKIPTIKNAMTKFGKELAGGLTHEAATEFVQSIISDLLKNTTLAMSEGENRISPDDYNNLTEIMSNALYSFYEGLKGGTIQQGVPSAVSAGMEIRAAKSATSQINEIENITDGLNDEKIQSKSESLTAEFIKKSAKHYDIGDSVIVDSDVVTKFYQETGMAPEEFARAFPHTQKAIDEAFETGQEVSIPMNELARIQASGFGDELLENFRVSHDALTLAEVRQLEQDILEYDKKREEEAKNNPVFEDVYQQLKSLGATDFVARQQALLWDARIRTRAKARNLSPEEMYAQSKLNLQEEEIARANRQDNYERLDSLLDAIRSGQMPTEKQAYGPSAMQFLVEQGGLRDEGGELKARDVGRVGVKNLIQPPEKGAISFDEAIERLVESGYLGGDTSEYMAQDVLDIIDNELAGQPLYSEQYRNAEAAGLLEELSYISDTLEQMGVDVSQMSNQEIKDILSNNKFLQTAYHGTHAKNIEKFLTDYIGTGEGAQAYGYGLYFASDKGVADWYKDKVSEKKGTKGQVYKVDLKPEEDEYLLWDRPLSEQSDKVKQAIIDKGDGWAIDTETGQSYYQKLTEWNTPPADENWMVYKGEAQKAASMELLAAGVRGIKYADASTRGKEGEQSYNYVIFDDKDVDITGTFYQKDEKDLIVQHNLTKENLLHADKMGGIAPPSLAVGKKQHPLKGFGEITLLAPADILNDPKAKIFNADVYSPRYPQVTYEVDLNKYWDKQKGMDDALKADGLDKRLPSMSDVEERGLERAFDKNEGAQYLYLKEKGKAPSIPYVKNEWKYNDKLKKYIGRDSHELKNDPQFEKDLTEFQKEISPEERFNRIAPEGKLSDSFIINTAHAFEAYQPKKIDTLKLSNAISKKIKGDYDGYMQWVKDNFEPAVKGERIFAGFTPSGKKRYIDHTLENVTRLMTKKVKDGENFSYGVGNVRAVASKQFKSVKAVQKERDKIISSEEMAVIKDEVDSLFIDLIEALKPYYKYDADGFRYIESAAENIKEMVTTGRLQDFEGVPSDIKKEVAEFLVRLRNLPTEYFETKMKRAMDIGEFDTAIVPTGKAYDKAVEILKNKGVKVRRYQKNKEGDYERAIGMSRKLFFQKQKNKAKGYYERTPLRDVFKITLTGQADLSTFIHESGHAFLDMLIQDAQTQPDAQEELQTILNWLGVESPDQILTPQHEQFARGFEAYLREGKAPSGKLKEAFRNFRIWLLRIYRRMTQLGVELTPEVRGVMDRMLATADEIEQARNDAGVLPTFQTLEEAQQAGLSEKEYEQYRQQYNDAIARQQELLESRRIREYNRQVEFANKERTRKARAKAEQNLQEKYSTWLLLKGKSDIQLPDTIGGDGQKVFYYNGKPRKLSKGSIQRVFPKIPSDRLRGLYSVDNGIDADVLAAELGYDSGADMVTELANLPPYKEALIEETANILKDEYGEMEAIPTPKEIVHGDPLTDFIKAELKVLGKRQGVAYTLKQQARERIARMVLADIKPITFERAERKASRKAMEALSNGDKTTAALEKQKQLYNHYLYKLATRALTDADKQFRYLKKLQTKKVRSNIGKAGENYLEAIDIILEKIQLKKVTNKSLARKNNLRQYIQKIQDEGLPVDESLVLMVQDKNYREMTTEEFEGVYQAAKNIHSIAKNKKKWLDKRKKRDFEKTVKQIADTITTNKKPVKERKGIMKKVAGWIRAGDSELVKAEFLFRWMDGGDIGFTWNTLFKPFQEAEAQEMDMNLEYTGKVMDIINRMNWRGSVRFMGETFEKSEVVAAALNIGNEGNLQRLLDGRNWNYQAVLNEIEKVLTKEDMDAIQEIWDTIDELYAPMSDVAQRAEGERPAKVEPMKFTLFGKEYKGGYYPAVYDPDKSSIGEAQEKEIGSKGFITTSVKGSSAKERAEKVIGVLSLDLNHLTKHIHETIFYITHYEAVYNTYHTLVDSRVKEAIRSTWGIEYYNSLKRWLDSIAEHGNIYGKTMAYEKILTHARSATSIAAMGYSVTTAIIQPLGLFNTVNNVGAYNTAKAALKVLINPLKTHKQISATYPEYSHLLNMFDRDMKKQIDTKINRNVLGKAYDIFSNNAFVMIGVVQRFVNLITYIAAENKYMSDDSLTYEQARDRVNSTVRTSQSMAGQKDLALVQVSKLMKMFTLFYSYFSVMYGQMRTGLRGENKAINSARMLAYVVILPSIVDTFLRGTCEETNNDVACYAGQVGIYTVAPIPLIRDIVNAVFSKYSYKVSPIEAVGSDFVRAVKESKKIFNGEGDDESLRKLVKGYAPLLKLPPKAITQIMRETDEQTDEWREIMLFKKPE